MIATYLSGITLAALSFFLTHYFRRVATIRGVMDIPNHRSNHQLPVPRGAGLIFIGLWLTAMTVAGFVGKITTIQELSLIPCVLIITVVGFFDDLSPQKPLLRFLIQCLAVITFLVIYGPILSLNFGFVISTNVALNTSIAFFLLLWSLNLFNFMDGTDALAASEALFVLVVPAAYLLYQAPHHVAWPSWLLIATVIGFLPLNLPKAKVFMGDVGSSSLGFIIIALGIVYQGQYDLPIFYSIMLYGVFLFDATLTLLRRVIAREKWYEAHRSHAYQRLIAFGLGHGQVVLSVTFINFLILIMVAHAWMIPKYAGWYMLSEIGLLTACYLQIESHSPMFATKKQ